MPVPEVFRCVPLNSPGVIFQYRIMLEVMSLLTLEQHKEFLAHFSSEQWSDPVQEGMEADVSSTSADGSPDEEVGVEKRIEEEDGDSSTSADAHKAVIASESSSTSPRRPWLSGRSSEESVNMSDMEVVDEVDAEEPVVREAPRRVRFTPVFPFNFYSVDSHFHLDRLCARIGISPVNFAKTVRRVRPEENVGLDGAVAVWCDPSTYPTKRQVSQLRKNKVVSVIGIHPGKVIEVDVERLATMLDSYEVVGLGEVGLDGTKGDPELQRRTLDEALVLLKARPRLVLVLHCRPGPRESFMSAYYELFYRCKGIHSPEQRIHLHCFNGSLEEVSLWLGYFPNTYFGYSLMVARRDFSESSKMSLRRIDGGRLLLESDAPYFPAAGEELSSPSFIGVTAQEVAKIRGCSWRVMLQQTAENDQQLYWG
ncbi:hypothetical protein DPMN_065019 [Dreissena polymorpha]|uniref:Uncharacterized protein n=2 Tax=Dreissena polymorpha TaxID=45954 RepID=A0A9D4CEX7_DREPO|nr:hypothetical protein DPMN_065019 [Dreissena polymorpha]